MDPGVSQNTLCNACKSMTGTLTGLLALTSPGGYSHLKPNEIMFSGTRGCKLCEMMCDGLSFVYTDPVQVFAQTASTMANTRPRRDGNQIFKGVIKGLEILYKTDGEARQTVDISVFTSAGDPASRFVQVQPLRIPVASSIITSAIKKRLANYQANHNLCPSESPPCLPTRVIDVGIGDPNPSPILHISKKGQRAEYVALSYCWGGPQMLKTTLETLVEYTMALPIELPKTIKDAIQITRDLGIRYLWVDAFCIIQDKHSDMSSEMRHMGLIYKYATLTIAAASAGNVYEGFIKDRPPLPMYNIPFHLGDDTYGNIWLRKHIRDVPIEPLDSRAWAFQESLLSSRLLYYGMKDLAWTCATERFVPVRATHNPYVDRESIDLSCIFSRRIPKSPSTAGWSLWKKIVEYYSSRALSDPNDRLPALAGLAREFQMVCNDGYSAGTWRGCLVDQLGWSLPPSSPTQRLTSYKSPTWSWASHEGGVFIDQVCSPKASVLNVEVILEDDSLIFGQVRSGKLVLQAPVRTGCDPRDMGTCTMDTFLPHEHLVMDGNTKFLLLGYNRLRILIGLILRPIEGGLFIRVGQFIARERWRQRFWKEENKLKEVVTII